MRRLVLILAVLASTGAAAADPAPEAIELLSGTTKLKAYLFRPEGKGPFPAVVALHGCAGLSGRGPVRLRYLDWGERLVSQGFVVLYPDSFGSRGLSSLCTVRERLARANRERVSDAIAARQWLQNQDFVAPDRVSLIGWQSGAVSVLWTVRRRLGVDDSGPDFRSAVALYPGCRRLADTAWSARVPTLVLVGSADDWTPAAPCEQMVAGARGRSAQVSIVVYPGAYAEFDHPNKPMQVLHGLAFSGDGSGRAHSGTNAAARADAIKRVPEWFSR